MWYSQLESLHGIFGALIGFVGTAIGIGVSGIAVMLVGIIGTILGVAFISTRIISFAMIFAGAGVTCLGILFSIATIWLFAKFIKLLIKYCNWNLKLIRGGI